MEKNLKLYSIKEIKNYDPQEKTSQSQSLFEKFFIVARLHFYSFLGTYIHPLSVSPIYHFFVWSPPYLFLDLALNFHSFIKFYISKFHILSSI